MNKSASIVIQVIVFAAIAILGIIYIMNRSPVEDLGEYEKQEMAKPNRGKSVIDQFFTPTSKKGGYDDQNDDVSLTGSSGRYDEVRIGKSQQE